MKKMKTSEQGITLIALIIMIIVLVIIAAVVIRMITDKNGLMNATANATENHKIASYKEQIMTKVQSSIILYKSKGQMIDLLQLATEINKETLFIKSAVANIDPDISNPDILVTTTDRICISSILR